MSSHQKINLGRSFNSWRWQIFFITWLGYVGFYFTRKSFSALKIGISNDPELLLTKTQMTQIDSAYLIAYAIGQFVLGVFGDRLGPRRVLLVGLLLSIIMGFLMGMSTTFLALAVFFTIQGFVQATGWAPLSKNLSYWFRQSERGTVMGWWSTNYTIGGLIASPLAAFCADYFGYWRYGFFGPALLLTLVWVLFFLLQKNRPEEVGYISVDTIANKKESENLQDNLKEEQSKQNDLSEIEDKKNKASAESSWRDVWEVLKNPIVWLLGFVYFCLKPMRYAILFWGPMYISEKVKTGMTESSLISICFELGGFFGVIGSGYISDKYFKSKRIPISIICMFALSFLVIFFDAFVCTQNKILIIFTLAGIGLLLYAPDSLLSGVAAVDFGQQKGASTAAGFINGCGSVGAILGGSLPGIVSEKFGWNWLFWFFAFTLFLAAVILIPFRNVVAKPQ